jgi:hypothetical protein
VHSLGYTLGDSNRAITALEAPFWRVDLDHSGLFTKKVTDNLLA